MSEDAYCEVVIGRFLLFILHGSSVRSLSLPTLHLLSFEPVTFFILHEYSASIEDASLGDRAEPMFVGTSNNGDSPVINKVFSMFKSYLKVKLEGKSKQIESKSKLDKRATVMKTQR